MRIKKRTLGIILLVIAVITVTVFASGDDPVISLSYLNEVFRPDIMSGVAQNISFRVIEIKSGERFYGSAGCEFILRGGGGIIKASEQGGVTDITSGTDLPEGVLVPTNHLLIIPRDDARGFVASSDSVVMVKGNYSIGK